MTDSSGDWTGLQAPETGTTIVAVCYDGGVVLGADSRVSTGTYVSNRASDKIALLSDQVYLLRSGSAADTQLVSDYGALLEAFAQDLHSSKGTADICPCHAVRYYAEQHAIGLDQPPSVKTIANLVKQVMVCAHASLAEQMHGEKTCLALSHGKCQIKSKCIFEALYVQKWDLYSSTLGMQDDYSVVFPDGIASNRQETLKMIEDLPSSA